MRRREFIVLVGGAVALPLAAHAQQRDGVRRIGVLETRSRARNANFTALIDELQKLGYVEGKNLIVEYQSAEGRGERFPELAAELLRLKVEVIVTRGTPATLAAKKATTSIPIVITAIGDASDAVGSLARPGGNVTGLSEFATELHAKRIELLKELIPYAQRLAFLSNLGNPSVVGAWNEVQRAARILGLQSQLLDVRKPEDFAPAFDAARAEHADGLLVGIEAVIQQNLEQTMALATKHRLPAIYASKEFIEVGGLIAYGPSYPDLYRHAAAYVYKVLKGEKPADLPIEQPTKFELIINLKTAKTLGLAIPQSVLLRADEVIE
jgi:putative tryptophan/tyrosine transport system substrate-binding protein